MDNYNVEIVKIENVDNNPNFEEIIEVKDNIPIPLCSYTRNITPVAHLDHKNDGKYTTKCFKTILYQ